MTQHALVALNYIKVSVPEPLFLKVKQFVEAHPDLGYRSASDLVTDAIRRRLEELDKPSAGDWLKRKRDAVEHRPKA